MEEEGHRTRLCADFKADLNAQAEEHKVSVWVEEDAESSRKWEGIVQVLLMVRVMRVEMVNID